MEFDVVVLKIFDNNDVVVVFIFLWRVWCKSYGDDIMMYCKGIINGYLLEKKMVL